MFDQIFLSPQVKLSVIISYKHGAHTSCFTDGEVNLITKALDTNRPPSQSPITPPRSATDPKIADPSKNSGNPA